MPRDKEGRYVNNKGVTFDFNTDKRGNNHLNFYGSDPREPHDAAHVNINYDKKNMERNNTQPR